MSTVFIARHPILDHKQRVFGYELLFRAGLENVFGQADGDEASSRVIADSLAVLGLHSLTGGRRAFINVTRRVLLEGYAELLPPEAVVIEVLEDVTPDAEVVAACARLKEKGYLLALDDVVDAVQFGPLADLADIVKVDFLATSAKRRRDIRDRYGCRAVRLVAEKVETPEVFREALALGYSYFQGYYFSKPLILKGRTVPAVTLGHLRVLREVVRADADLDTLASIIEREMGLSYKLLRYVNSASFALRGAVRSVRHALSLLGQCGARTWASLMVVTALAGDKPRELVLRAAIRA